MATQNQYVGRKVQMDGKTFVIVEANNGDVNCISLQNDNTRLFLRHKDGRLIETDEKDNPAFFASDSSFITEERGDGFVLRCSNQGMEDNYICKLDIDTYIISEDLVEYVFFAVATPMRSTEMTFHPTNGSINQGIELFYGCHIDMKDTSYLIVPANDEQVEHISLMNASDGSYARHFNGKLINSTYEDSEIFSKDSSFHPEFVEDGVFLHCVNNGMENLSIAYNGDHSELIVHDTKEAFSISKTAYAWPWEILKKLIPLAHAFALSLEKNK